MNYYDFIIIKDIIFNIKTIWHKQYRKYILYIFINLYRNIIKNIIKVIKLHRLRLKIIKSNKLSYKIINTNYKNFNVVILFLSSFIKVVV